jgi:hypothetical protein
MAPRIGLGNAGEGEREGERWELRDLVSFFSWLGFKRKETEGEEEEVKKSGAEWPAHLTACFSGPGMARFDKWPVLACLGQIAFMLRGGPIYQNFSQYKVVFNKNLIQGVLYPGFYSLNWSKLFQKVKYLFKILDFL